MCEEQPEAVYYWDKLATGGQAGCCGWLKVPFGASWQDVPVCRGESLRNTNPEIVRHVTQAFMPMKKLDVGALERRPTRGCGKLRGSSKVPCTDFPAHQGGKCCCADPEEKYP